ncbi:MAG: hypothetical protein ABJL54_03015 [Halioglobus sp.]
MSVAKRIALIGECLVGTTVVPGRGGLCLSGISLAIFTGPSLQRLFDMLEAYRNSGGRVIFDSNCHAGSLK